jgi:hypothetical protein
MGTSGTIGTASQPDTLAEIGSRTALIGARQQAVIVAAERMVDHGMSDDRWRLLCAAIVRLRELEARTSTAPAAAGVVAKHTSLEHRLAALLAKIINQPFVAVGAPNGTRRNHLLYYGSFRSDLANEAVGLLEEAGL